MIFAQQVTREMHGKGKYGRILADVLLADGTNVNHTLVKDGWCWWYRKYTPDDTVLEALETEAREAKRGLWVIPNPTPPWEWRKRGGRTNGTLRCCTTASDSRSGPARLPEPDKLGHWTYTALIERKG